MREGSSALEPGDVILSGSFIKAMPFDAGDTVMALHDEFGVVSFSVA